MILHTEYSELDEATMRLLSLLVDMNFYDENKEDEEVPDVCKALEDIKKMGEREGEARGEASVVRNMFHNGISCEDIASMTNIPLVQVKEIVSVE